MSLKSKNLIGKQNGFTIVELLIVIVVIAILAAITIVAYSGITARANTTKAQTNAIAVKKVAEAYNADTGRYPATLAEFSTGSTSTKLPSGVSVVAGLAGTSGTNFAAGTEPTNATNGATTVSYACLLTCTNSTGGRITYWDFTASARGTIIYVGAANATSGAFVAP